MQFPSDHESTLWRSLVVTNDAYFELNRLWPFAHLRVGTFPHAVRENRAFHALDTEAVRNLSLAGVVDTIELGPRTVSRQSETFGPPRWLVRLLLTMWP